GPAGTGGEETLPRLRLAFEAGAAEEPVHRIEVVEEGNPIGRPAGMGALGAVHGEGPPQVALEDRRRQRQGGHLKAAEVVQQPRPRVAVNHEGTPFNRDPGGARSLLGRGQTCHFCGTNTSTSTRAGGSFASFSSPGYGLVPRPSAVVSRHET